MCTEKVKNNKFLCQHFFINPSSACGKLNPILGVFWNQKFWCIGKYTAYGRLYILQQAKHFLSLF